MAFMIRLSECDRAFLAGLFLFVSSVAPVAQAIEFADSTRVNLIFYLPGVTFTEYRPGGGGASANALLVKYAAGVFDGSFWNANSGSNTNLCWLQADLGAGNSRPIYRVAFSMYTGQQAPEYWIWVGDDQATFTNGGERVHVTGNAAIAVDHTFAVTTGRYIRIQQQHSAPDQWYNMQELTVESTDVKPMTTNYPVSEIGSCHATITDTSGYWRSWDGADAGGETNLFCEYKSTDGDAGYRARRCKATLASGNAPLIVEFDRSYTLDYFVMHSYGNDSTSWGPTNSMILELSVKGTSYSTVTNQSLMPYQSVWTIPIGRVDARYGKITLTTIPRDAIIYRMDFYGKPTSPRGTVVFIR